MLYLIVGLVGRGQPSCPTDSRSITITSKISIFFLFFFFLFIIPYLGLTEDGFEVQFQVSLYNNLLSFDY